VTPKYLPVVCEWTNKAISEAEIGEDARTKILHRTAAAMIKLGVFGTGVAGR
jgi:hypothetical protein